MPDLKNMKPQRIRLILILSMLLNVAALAFIIKISRSRHYTAHDTPIHEGNYSKPVRSAYYLERQKLFEKLPGDTNSIIFLGNSLTQNFEFADFFHNPDIKNRGIESDDIAGVLNRLKPIIDMHPKKIFIEIGINDLGYGWSKDSVIVNYKKLLNTLQKSCGKTTIYVQSIFPVLNNCDKYPTYCNPEINNSIIAVNKAIKIYSDENNITFIDTYSAFVLNGQLNPIYSVDGVHLSADGYHLWANILLPYVKA